jgi:hypothetical protein
MDTDFFNPARRFKHFRPRQASRGMKVQGVPTNRATISLFNNSSGPYVLVVRDFSVNGTANDNIVTSYQPGQIGSSQGLVTALLPGEAIQNGLIASIDTTTVYPGDYTINLSSLGTFEWMHDWPFAVIEPSFSLVFQATVAAHAVTVSALWEAIQIDQLDYFY